MTLSYKYHAMSLSWEYQQTVAREFIVDLSDIVMINGFLYQLTIIIIRTIVIALYFLFDYFI